MVSWSRYGYPARPQANAFAIVDLPQNPAIGDSYYVETLRLPLWWDGTEWRDAARTEPDVFLAGGWFSARDAAQVFPNRVPGADATLGLTSGVAGDDPLALSHDGTHYVYLPGSAGNSLSIPKDGAWAATIHVTATRVDGTTSTFTTTASPILVGETLLPAGAYSGFVLRDNTESGTIRVSIAVGEDIDTTGAPNAGQLSFTSTTGQTVTVNRSTSGIATTVVTRPVVVLDGASDCIQFDAELTPSFTKLQGRYTAVVMFRKHVTQGNADRLICFSGNPAAGNDGCHLRFNSTDDLALVVGDSAGQVTATQTADIVDGALSVGAFVVDDAAAYAYLYGAGLSAAGNLSTLASDPTFGSGRIGLAAYSPVFAYTGEIFDVLCFPDVALSGARLDSLSADLIAGSFT